MRLRLWMVARALPEPIPTVVWLRSDLPWADCWDPSDRPADCPRLPDWRVAEPLDPRSWPAALPWVLWLLPPACVSELCATADGFCSAAKATAAAAARVNARSLILLPPKLSLAQTNPAREKMFRRIPEFSQYEQAFICAMKKLRVAFAAEPSVATE